MIGWLAVVLLGLIGRLRAAAAIASIPLALALLNLVVEVMQLSGAWSGGLPMFLWTAGLVAPVVMASRRARLPSPPARSEAWQSWEGGEPAL